MRKKINYEKKIKRNDVTCAWFSPDVFGPNLM